MQTYNHSRTIRRRLSILFPLKQRRGPRNKTCAKSYKGFPVSGLNITSFLFPELHLQLYMCIYNYDRLFPPIVGLLIILSAIQLPVARLKFLHHCYQLYLLRKRLLLIQLRTLMRKQKANYYSHLIQLRVLQQIKQPLL